MQRFRTERPTLPLPIGNTPVFCISNVWGRKSGRVHKTMGGVRGHGGSEATAVPPKNLRGAQDAR